MSPSEKLGIALGGLSIARISIESILAAYGSIPDHVRKALEETVEGIDDRYIRAKHSS